MIRNDAAYHDANVKIVSIGGGFSYGSLGISHHATEDLSIMRAIPNLTCLSPSGFSEVIECTKAMVETPGACYLRLDKDPGYNESNEKFILGKPRKIQTGNDIAFFVTGGIMSEVVKASEILDKDYDIKPSIFSIHTIKPINFTSTIEELKKYKLIVTVEENTIIGGLGSLMLETLSNENIYPNKFLRIGLDGCFSSVVGSQEYLRKTYNMSSGSIVRQVLKSFNDTK